MSSSPKGSHILRGCLLTGLLLTLAGCSQLNPPHSGLIQDPANETQSAIASLVAATTTPLPVSVTPSPPPTAALPSQPARIPTSNAAQACAASDLLVNVRSDITGNDMVFTVALSNAGNHPCILMQPPKASLITQQGARLDVDATPGCVDCIPKAPAPGNSATRTAIAPTQTAAAQSSGQAQIDLGSNQTAVVVFRWTNWCNPFPPGGVAIRLDLASGDLLTLPTDAQKAGTCTASGQRSVLAVSPFFISP